MSTIQKFAWLYAAMAVGVVVFGYIPGVTDNQGLMLGLFKIDPVDDLIHFLTGVAAAFAAWHSAQLSKYFFVSFVLLYGLDVVAGFFLQRGLLDLTVISISGGSADFGMTNFLINLPHILLVSFALLILLFTNQRRPR